ncbi:MAG: hypothetical protein AAF657_20110 [Acidobacteriota bacterium]
MKKNSLSLARLLAVVFLAAVFGCDDDSNPTAPGTPQAPSFANGSFRVSGAGENRTYSFSNGPNTVFCTRDAGFASLFIRLAEQAGGGGNGPHVDMDLCNHAGGGDFGPKDPRNPSCGSAKTWNIFWHAADGSVFVNTANAPNCNLRIDQNGAELSGMFECRDLVEDSGGSRTLDILEGSFNCTESG